MLPIDPAKARKCKGCRTPMVPHRKGRVVPEGFRRHSGHGYCSSCYRSPGDVAESGALMWTNLPVGDIWLPTFHRYAPPPPWTEGALCAQVDPEVFFPPKGGDMSTAKSICAKCPVAALCLTYALENGEEWGVWGGATPGERQALKAAAS